MPVNTTVSHISPLLNYIPRSAWYELTPESDSILVRHPPCNYHATNATVSGSASMTFSWWGQGVIFGEYREWLGRYRVTLDGSKTEHDGYTGGKERLGDYVLFSAPDLPLGQHHLRITNIGDDLSRPILDIAHLIFQSESGSVDVVEHNSTLCVWTPKIAYAWQVDALSHTTFLSSGAMGMNFTVRTGIAIYGPLDASSAPFSVTLDSETHPPLAPNTAVQSPLTNSSTLLFVKTGLFDGPHTLWVENNPVSESPGDGSAATGVTKMSIAQMGVFRDAISTPG
ncbi:hypothetical protein BV20DRAFT_949354 [Pilatotrama ljubarskyi]|nr:hypothetical protein BV20DRAFT_949354 [Pilatotrama ljubarskyi]